MAYPAIDLVAGFFFDTFGGGLLMGLVIVGTVLLLLAAVRANMATVLLVLVPLVAGLVLNTLSTNYLDFPAWVLIVLVAVMGFIFATAFFVMTR